MKRIDYTRCHAVVDALCALHCESKLTQANVDAVLAILAQHDTTFEDFQCLDESPGCFGYREHGFEHGWHWKLRQVRNQHGRALCATLAKEGNVT